MAIPPMNLQPSLPKVFEFCHEMVFHCPALSKTTPLPFLLYGLAVAAMLSGCVTPDIGGPVAPAGASGAGILTLSNGRSYPVYPDGLAYTGTGAYRWPDGRTYDGQFLEGKPEGIGTGTSADGDRYRGTWHEGHEHGHGELTRSDGSRYVGDFVQGVRQGTGVEQSEEGLYRGEWQRDLPDGHGEFHGTDGAVYEGRWSKGQRQGFGAYTDPSGNRYEGDWYADAPDGFGVMTNANGSVYEGEWRDSKQNGYGKVTTEAGVVYEGTWVKGARQGFGVARRPDGSSYEGEWVADRREGRGRESFPDGSYHEGQWQGDRPIGPGSRRDRTGITIHGNWDGDQLDSGTLTLPSGAAYTGRLLYRGNRAVDPALLSWLTATAKAGDAYAHFFLGTAYSDFADPRPDQFRATSHFRAAAQAGIPDGQFRLALLLRDRAPTEALQWLRRAAAAGQAQANTLLAEYYLTGTQVPRDLELATRYLRAGSDAGDLMARINLAWLLATTDEPGLRDGEASLALIRPLALMHGSWRHYDTLAAAYAAIGNFQEAKRSQLEAIHQALASLGEESLEVSAMRGRLLQYQSGQPIRE
jgi:hypothetical protein